MMPPAGDKEQDRPLVEHRRDHGDIGQMCAAIIGVVQDKAVALIDRALIVTDHRPHRLAHRTQMHRHMRRIGDQRARRIENCTGEIKPLLDIDRQGRVLQRIAHLFGERHEQIVEHLEHHRIAGGADRNTGSAAHHAAQHQIANRRHLRLPARFDNRRSRGLDDQCRSVNPAFRRHPVTVIDGCGDKCAGHIGLDAADRCRLAGYIVCLALQIKSMANRLDRDCRRDHALARHDKAEARTIGGLIGGNHFWNRAKRHLERGIRSIIAQMQKSLYFNLFWRDLLSQNLITGNRCQLVKLTCDARQ